MTNKMPSDTDLKIYSIDTAREMLKDTIGDEFDKELQKEFFELAKKIYNFIKD